MEFLTGSVEVPVYVAAFGVLLLGYAIADIINVFRK